MSKSIIHYMWQTASISKSFSFLKHLLLFFKLFLDQEMSENYQTKWRIDNRSTSKMSRPLGRLSGFPSGQFQKTAGQFSKTAGQIGRLGHKYQALSFRYIHILSKLINPRATLSLVHQSKISKQVDHNLRGQ